MSGIKLQDTQIGKLLLRISMSKFVSAFINTFHPIKISLLIYDLQPEDWINTYYMLKGFLKAHRPPKVSNGMKCTNERMTWNTQDTKLICAQDYCRSHHKWPRNCCQHFRPLGHHTYSPPAYTLANVPHVWCSRYITHAINTPVKHNMWNTCNTLVLH